MLLHVIPLRAYGAVSASFSWEANPEAVDGYRLYYGIDTSGPPYDGTGATEGPSPVKIADMTSFDLHGLSETETYYFTLTAYIGSEESGYSEEIILLPATDSTNALPAAADASFSTTKNTAISAYLTASDPENDPLTYSIVNTGSLGSAAITDPATGAFTYTPNTDAVGYDLFTFKVSDGTADSNTATITVFIDDPDSITSVFGDTANADSPGTLADTYTNINTNIYAAEDKLRTYSWSSPTPHKIANSLIIKADLAAVPGNAVILDAKLYLYQIDANGQAVYTNSIHKITGKNPQISHVSGYNTDSGTPWTPVSAGTTYNDVPLGLADIAPQEDSIQLDAQPGYRTWQITNMVTDWVNNPSTNYGLLIKGEETSVETGRAFASSEYLDETIRPKLVIRYSITETSVNEPPAAINASLSVNENTPMDGLLIASDPDNDPLTFAIVTNGSLGSAVITNSATGAFTYTPNQDAAGSDSFSFKANDGYHDSNTATVGIIIEAGNDPPKAVISTSASVGDVPLEVQFDGTGSTDSDGTISAYVWNFGDGGTAAGATVSHTYNTAGSYNATLTVTDNSNTSDSTSTPILATEPANQVPVSSFTVSADQGLVPLTVTFDGSGSNDADGEISAYTWNFGDGTGGTGVSVSHTFIGAGEYKTTLEVTDNQGAVGQSSRLITVQAPEPAIMFEYDRLSINTTWTHVELNGQFTNPVVVAGPLSTYDNDPATVRLRNITPSGFDIRIEEWDYLDGYHPFETVHYMVMEQGSYTLANGARIEAGTFTGSFRFKSVSFAQAFSVEPVVFTTIATINDTTPVTGRLRKLSAAGFEYSLSEQEANKNRKHADETVGYIAIEPGKGSMGHLLYEAGRTGNEVTEQWHGIDFEVPFVDSPLFFADMQSWNSSDNATVRYHNLFPGGVRVFIEEETSKDSETVHPGESVGYLVFSPVSE